jgi:hypothetical protein
MRPTPSAGGPAVSDGSGVGATVGSGVFEVVGEATTGNGVAETVGRVPGIGAVGSPETVGEGVADAAGEAEAVVGDPEEAAGAGVTSARATPANVPTTVAARATVRTLRRARSCTPH